MTDVLHRTTKALLRSVNTPSYPVVDYVHNPDLSAVTGVPNRYWKINPDDTITEMSQPEKDDVDQTVGSGQILAAKFEITEKERGKVAKIRYYATDNGDGTYSDLVHETIYTYQRRHLLSEEYKTYYSNGVLASTTRWEYYTSPSGNVVKKLVP